ncbi:MAG: alanine dehydrogenase [Deltaproteobacteria bacterium HGW-Deltaproteobacteria-13]|jgi:alanine dehydrogenase|nr:MAG: alanine dehydrogenase [Deltaproteobacteria bacterium HGW-Deltaproteobacteria-13]
MKISIPKEIKIMEGRVAITPAGVKTLVENGHTVYVEKNAGIISGIGDDKYIASGAIILDSAADVWDAAEMILKVKEPLEPEFSLMKEGQILFTFLHLAADRTMTDRLLKKKIIGIAYETVQLPDGSLPLLAPMSEIAGRLAIQMGCACLEIKNGGKGILLSGVPGVASANVTIVGGGIAGLNAAHLAAGIGARVTILDVNLARLRYLEDIFHSRAVTLMANSTNIEESCAHADLIIGSVLIPGAQAPKLITRDILRSMEKGSALVDIAIDQGGCAETSKPTTHLDPIYIQEGIVHYCVANMPGAVPRTSTFALTNATLPYAVAIANKGYRKAIADDPALARGVNVHKGNLTCSRVAEAFCMDYTKIAAA